ncbi:MAG: hypothetical protein LUC33_04540 [Prevotellaceae bacterium]|nr:hypothetical protein [Prevotellaceae bacterium]
MELTENKVAEIATDDLLERAATIRDAVKTKSVTAEQVGSLFYDLVEACGDIRDALALFLDTNLTEILDGIDDQLAAVTAAVEKAKEAAANLSAKVEQTDDGAVVTVTDADGSETTATLTNGKDGADGSGTADIEPITDEMIDEMLEELGFTINASDGSANASNVEFREITAEEVDELFDGTLAGEEAAALSLREITADEVAEIFDATAGDSDGADDDESDNGTTLL